MNQPVLPSAITVRRYRCFVDPTRLELRPITLLFGVNNSGKSALLRLLPLLSDSSGPQSPPLNLESAAARGASYGELQSQLFESTDADRDLGLTFEWPDSSATLDVSFFFYSEWKRLLVRRLTLVHEGREDVFEWVYRPEDQNSGVLSYEWAREGLRTVTRLKVAGILGLQAEEEAAKKILEPMVARLSAMANRVQWLSATRKPAETRLRPFPGGPRWILKPDGEDAADVLVTNPAVRAKVSLWYETAFGRELKTRDIDRNHFQLVLRQQATSLEVDLADSGEGLAQLLPMLTAFELGRRSSEGGPALLAIEEPESHLHPSLQVKLAEHLCRSVAEGATPRLLLETHSEHFLLGVQLQVVLGRLDPKQAVIYWVRQLPDGSSVADRIELDELGRPVGDSIPPGVFEENLEVSRQIVEERLRREGIEF